MKRIKDVPSLSVFYLQDNSVVGVFSDTRVQFPALDVTMAPKEPQPRVEGVSLSGAMARQGGQPKSRSTTFYGAPA